jgi:4'-phosphopantetheinyl transferase
LPGWAVSTAVDQLSPDERTRHARLIFERDRRDFAVAHALLRQMLSAHVDRPPREWTFVPGPHGKPMLEPEASGCTLSFNLAHTHGLVTCAITTGTDIGIDVEPIDRGGAALELAQRYFSSVEVAEIERLTGRARETRFIEIWTLKEAYVKAIGDGLTRPVDEFWFTFEESRRLGFESSDPDDSADWSFALFAPSPEYRLAVAVRGPSTTRRFSVHSVADANARPALVTSGPLRTSR